MHTSTESTPTPSAAAGAVHECDFCGEAVHQATSVEPAQSGGDEPETVTLCVVCALGVD